MRLGIVLVTLGILMALHSYSLPIYVDEVLFKREVAQIGNIDAAQHFYIIQKKYLTLKYTLLDYSVCAFLLGIVSIAISSIGFNNLRSPSSTISLTFIGIAAVGLSVVAYYSDGMVHLSRDLSPPWSPIHLPDNESLKKLLYFLISWLGLHCLILRKDFQTSKRFHDLSLDFIALGLLSSTLVAGGFALVTIIGGQPIYAVPALLWFYFHLSLLAGKQSTRRME